MGILLRRIVIVYTGYVARVTEERGREGGCQDGTLEVLLGLHILQLVLKNCGMEFEKILDQVENEDLGSVSTFWHFSVSIR